MLNLATNPAFIAYAVAVVVLSLNMLVLWGYSGAVRGRSKTTPNTEDSRGNNALIEMDPPEVARVLRAHRNATANIVPFAILGLVYVLAGGGATVAEILFGAFTLSRLAHSVAYLGGRQPWRTIFFTIGGLTTLVLIGFIVGALVTAT